MNYLAVSHEVSEFSAAGLDFPFPSPGVSTACRDGVCKAGDRPVAPTLPLSAYSGASSGEFFSIKAVISSVFFTYYHKSRRGGPMCPPVVREYLNRNLAHTRVRRYKKRKQKIAPLNIPI